MVVLEWALWNCCSTIDVPPCTRNLARKRRRGKVVMRCREDGLVQWRTRSLPSQEGEEGGTVWRMRTLSSQEGKAGVIAMSVCLRGRCCCRCQNSNQFEGDIRVCQSFQTFIGVQNTIKEMRIQMSKSFSGNCQGHLA